MRCINFSHYDSPVQAEHIFEVYFPNDSVNNEHFQEAVNLISKFTNSLDLNLALNGLTENHRTVHFSGGPRGLSRLPAEGYFQSIEDLMEERK